MNEWFWRFRDLLLTDEEFREKLKAAMEAYEGDQTEEAIFHNVLVPLAAEYGISATFEEYKAFIDGLREEKMNEDELEQIAGGAGKGAGAGLAACLGPGVGVGGGGGSGAGVGCIVYGVGWGQMDCIGLGTTSTV